MKPSSNPNNNPLAKRFLVVVFLVVSIICIIFFAAVSRFNAPLASRITVTVLAPFQTVTSVITNKCHDFSNYVADVFYVYDKNQQLQAENDMLKAKAYSAAELESENARLRSLLNYKETHKEFQLLPATIIGRDSSTWSSHVIINRGTDDGVQKNMTVVTPDGLVGSIHAAYGAYSEVELITDPRSAVSAIVQRPDSRIAGVVKGASDSNSSINMNNIPQNANIVEGDVIITSGLGGIYPKGIPIGSVLSLKNDTGGLLQYAVLYPCVDFQKLEEVAVIINYQNIMPVNSPPVTNQEAQQQNKTGDVQ